VHWYGLDWTNILLGTAMLAIIPFAFALYGGYLATEPISDLKRRRNIKLQFWGLFVLGVALGFWQQFREAGHDLDRDTKGKWADALVGSKFPPPSPPYIEREKAQVIPRSYITADGNFRFLERRDKDGKLLPDQHLQVGEILGFNVYWKTTGPDPIEVVRSARGLYIEPDTAPKTQESLIAAFKAAISHENKLKPSTMMPGDARWSTAVAVTAENKPLTVTAEDLARLRDGTEFPFVIAEVTYKDHGVVHHARWCQWLQPPPDPPGIWHFCDGFNNSD